MSDNESEQDQYDKDSRIACKYGANCYQKNPAHHSKYKHPVKKDEQVSHTKKKAKIEEKDKKIVAVTISNDVSDSDDDTDTESKEKGESSKVEVVPSSSNDSKSDNLHNTDFDHKTFIKQKFVVDMPEDFYQFWEFCKRLKPRNTVDALKDIGLMLVGPFDVLAGKFKNTDIPDERYLIHWRYYRDPPELQTVLKGDDKTGYHIGYFRDSPDEPPVFLASNSAEKDGVLYQMGGNIFTAVYVYLDELKKTGDPFKKMHVAKFQASIKAEAKKLKLYLLMKTDAVIARERKIVTRTFNKIGLVVPYDKKTQEGYRKLAFNDKDLETLFTKLQNVLPEQRQKFLSELQPVFTFASIATDECDFGTGIELGWNIISHGVDHLNPVALRFLASNYRLLKREAFAKIAEAHMNNRKKGCSLSII